VGRIERRLSARAVGAHGDGEQRDCPGRWAAGVCVKRRDGAGVGRVERQLFVRAGDGHKQGVEGAHVREKRGVERDRPGRRAVGVRVERQDGAGVGRVERCLSARAEGAHGECEQRNRPGRRAAGIRVGRQNGAGVERVERRLSVRAGRAHKHCIKRDRPG